MTSPGSEHFDAVVDVSVDTTAAKSEVAALNQRIRDLSNKKLDIRADTAKARLEIASLKRQVDLGASFGLDMSQAKERIKGVQRDLRDLSVVRLKADADTAAARAKIQRLNQTVHVDVDTDDKSLNGVRNKLADIGNLSGFATRALSQVPPQVLAIGAAFGVAAGSALAAGAAVGTAVTAVGALGVAATTQNAIVRQEFTNTANRVKGVFGDAAQSLVPSVVRALDRAESHVASRKPLLDRLFASSAPLLDRITDSLFNMADRVLPGVEDALSKSGPLVDGIADGAEAMAAGVGQFFDTVAEDGENAGETFRGLGEAVGGLVILLGNLASGWSKVDSTFRGFSRGVSELGSKVGGESGIFGRRVSDVLNVLNKNPLALFDRDAMTRGIAERQTLAATNANIVAPRRTASDVVAQVTGRRPEVRITQEMSDAATKGYEAWLNASKSFTQAEASEAAVRTQNMRSESAARRAVASAQQSLARVQEDGLRQIARAEQAVADAQGRTRTAQVALTQARRDAAQAILDMRAMLRDLPDTEEEARIRVERARLAAEEAGLPVGGTFSQADLDRRASVEQDLRKRESLLELKNAQEELDDTLAGNQKVRDDVAEAERRGIENAPNVLAAKQNLTMALKDERQAEQALRDTRVDAARAVASAQEALSASTENLNNTIADNAARAAEARERTQELADKEAKAKAEADLLAASLGITTDELGNYIASVEKVPTLALKMTGENALLDALDAITIKARALELLAQNPKWTAEKATQEATNEILALRKKAEGNKGSQGFRMRHMADGGSVSGPRTGRDSVPAMLMPGEFVQPTDTVDHYGVAFMEALRSKKIPRFASGGMVDWKALDVGAMNIPKLIEENGIYDRIRANMSKRAKAAFEPMVDSGPISGSLGSWIAEAIARTGVPASWTSPLHTLIMRESGGNPKAINLWDSNAQAGYPSQGLMQTIPQTFAAHRDPGLPNDITHPIANIVAGIRYIQSRYGSIFNVQQANPSAPPQGYASGGLVFDDGGMLPTGPVLVNNKTGSPEPLVNAAKGITLSTESIRALARAMANQPTQVLMPDGRVLADTVGRQIVSEVTVSGVI